MGPFVAKGVITSMGVDNIVVHTDSGRIVLHGEQFMKQAIRHFGLAGHWSLNKKVEIILS